MGPRAKRDSLGNDGISLALDKVISKRKAPSAGDFLLLDSGRNEELASDCGLSASKIQRRVSAPTLPTGPALQTFTANTGMGSTPTLDQIK